MRGISRAIPHAIPLLGATAEYGINMPLIHPQDQPRNEPPVGQWAGGRPEGMSPEEWERINPHSFTNSGLTREEYDAETARIWEGIRRSERWGNRVVQGIQIASLVLPPLLLIGAGEIMRVKYPDEEEVGNSFIMGGVLLGVCFSIFGLREFCKSRLGRSAASGDAGGGAPGLR